MSSESDYEGIIYPDEYSAFREGWKRGSDEAFNAYRLGYDMRDNAPPSFLSQHLPIGRSEEGGMTVYQSIKLRVRYHRTRTRSWRPTAPVTAAIPGPRVPSANVVLLRMNEAIDRLSRQTAKIVRNAKTKAKKKTPKLELPLS